MARFKFSDQVKTPDGKKGTVQEDQETGSKDVKVQLQGEDVSHIYNADELIPDTDED